MARCEVRIVISRSERFWVNGTARDTFVTQNKLWYDAVVGACVSQIQIGDGVGICICGLEKFFGVG